MQADLIYDVGVNDGSDSQYYLRRAKRVVGIEAHPGLIEELQKRFASEIAEGRYVLLNVAVGERDGEFQFWVCDDHSEWSSFDRRIASRNGARHHEVSVRARPFASILAEHGTPYYCKIDIEGHDRVCLHGVTRQQVAPYISIEMSHRDGGSDFELLAGLGYRWFKIVNQSNFTPAAPGLATLRMPKPIKRRLTDLHRRFTAKPRDGSWVFPIGSSGPFGEDAPGPWLGLPRALRVWRALRDDEGRSIGDWFDIHAKSSGAI